MITALWPYVIFSGGFALGFLIAGLLIMARSDEP